MYFYFILSMIDFISHILDFYKASEGGSYSVLLHSR